MEKINPRNISKVKVNFKKIDRHYDFQEEISFFGLCIAPEGFTYSYDITNTRRSPKTVLKENKNVYIEDNVVYYKPFVEIISSNGDNDYYWFETESAVKEFLRQDGFKEVNWIEYA